MASGRPARAPAVPMLSVRRVLDRSPEYISWQPSRISLPPRAPGPPIGSQLIDVLFYRSGRVRRPWGVINDGGGRISFPWDAIEISLKLAKPIAADNPLLYHFGFLGQPQHVFPCRDQSMYSSIELVSAL